MRVQDCVCCGFVHDLYMLYISYPTWFLFSPSVVFLSKCAPFTRGPRAGRHPAHQLCCHATPPSPTCHAHTAHTFMGRMAGSGWCTSACPSKVLASQPSPAALAVLVTVAADVAVSLTRVVLTLFAAEQLPKLQPTTVT